MLTPAAPNGAMRAESDKVAGKRDATSIIELALPALMGCRRRQPGEHDEIINASGESRHAEAWPGINAKANQ